MRLVLLFLLVLVTAPAWAEWVKMNESDAAITYVDPATIRKNGDLRRVWELQDLKQQGDKGGEMSRRVLWEYDCKEERERLLSFTWHSEPMAGGRILVRNDDPSKWAYVAPGTVGELILRLVCAH